MLNDSHLPVVRRSLSIATLALGIVGCSDDTSVDPAQHPGNDAGMDVANAADVVEAAAEDAEQEAAEPFDFDGSRMHHDVAELASAPYGGRMPGSPGGVLALEYVEQHFSDLGLTPLGTEGFRTPFNFDLWLQTGPSALAIDQTAWIEGQDFGLLMGSGSANVEGSLVFAGYGLTVPAFDAADHPACPLPTSGYDDYEGLDVTGKVVLVFRQGPDGNDAVQDGCPANAAAQSATQALWTFGYKAANAALHGAAGLLVVNRFGTAESTPIQGTLGAEYQDTGFVVASVDRQRIAAVLPDLSAWQTSIDDTLSPASTETGSSLVLVAQTAEETRETHNLIAAFPGTDPTLSQEAVVFGAHVDHLGIDPVTESLFAGADDNASGTAVMMELGRALSAGLIEPKRTIILAAFNAEEEGLYGSCSYVQNPSHPIAKTAAMFSIDMVGLGDGKGVVLYGGDGQTFPWLGELMKTSAAAAEVAGSVTQGPVLDASDHVCFAMAGVPAVLVSSSGAHATYHTFQDTADAILPDALETSARLLWSALTTLASEEKLNGSLDVTRPRRSIAPPIRLVPMTASVGPGRRGMTRMRW